MKAVLVDVMGSDLKVVNAARVSFSKKSDWEYDEKETQFIDQGQPVYDTIKVNPHLSTGDEKLIRYLAKHGHWTPFAHCQLTFHVKAPIFVARQLVKHQIGLVWNEVSRRYVSDEPEFWWPNKDEWRLAAANKKQGSSDEFLDRNAARMSQAFEFSIERDAKNNYKFLLDAGVAPEMARMVLPVNLYTEWHWTGSLMAFARVCKLRLDAHAQKEVQYIAADIYREINENGSFKISWDALMTPGVAA